MKPQSRKDRKGSQRILFVIGLACILSLANARAEAVKLAWDPNSEGTVSGYNVYRGTIAGGPYSLINTSLVMAPFYSDYSAEPGKTYYYVVTAVNLTAGRESAYSRELKVVTGRYDPSVLAGLPTVRVMADMTVRAGEMVHLTGSGWHTEGDTLTYAWTQLDGPAVSLAASDTADAGFIAPYLNADTWFTFKLTATDTAGATASDSVRIKVLAK